MLISSHFCTATKFCNKLNTFLNSDPIFIESWQPGCRSFATPRAIDLVTSFRSVIWKIAHSRFMRSLRSVLSLIAHHREGVRVFDL